MLIKDQGLILRTIRYADADLIVHVLTRQGDSLSLMAKSALKSKKRFGGGVLEPTHFIKFAYKGVSEGSERMPILQEADMLESFQGLREDYERLNLGLYFISVAEKVCRENPHPGRELFDLVGNGLRSAEKGKRLTELKTVFEIKFLDQQGVLPHDDDYLKIIRHPVRDLQSLNVKTSTIAKERLRHLLESYIS